MVGGGPAVPRRFAYLTERPEDSRRWRDRRALSRLLRSAGFAVATFASGEDFLAAGAREAADCLILDVRLPGLSGFDVQAALAAGGSRLPVVFITAYEDEQAHQRALATGAVALFHKPFEVVERCETIVLLTPHVIAAGSEDDSQLARSPQSTRSQ